MIRIRSTESNPHPMWLKMEETFHIIDIQGFIFEATDSEVIQSAKNGSPEIVTHCIEAIEYDKTSDPFQAFSTLNWLKKCQVSKFFQTDLKVITHNTQEKGIFNLYNAFPNNKVIDFKMIKKFESEDAFAN